MRAHSNDLLRAGYVLTGSRFAAEDLLQDTLTHLYPQWHRVATAQVPVAYVHRVMANRFVSSRRLRTNLEQPIAEPPDRWDDRAVDDLVATRQMIWQQLATLSAKQRAAVVLHYYQDLTDEQIGAWLDCRPATVRSLISRAMASMRANMSNPDVGTMRTETSK